MTSVKKLYNALVKEGEPIIHYDGVYSDEILESILKRIDTNISVSKKMRRKLFFVSIELLQNIHHHALEISLNKKRQVYFYFLVSKINSTTYKISAGNFINNNILNVLVRKIEYINSLKPAEIKVLYKSVLTNNTFSKKGGGGLGIIDLKKRSEQKIEYKHINFNKNLYFFNFSIFLLNKI